MYEYDISEDKWNDTNTPLSRERYSHSCLLVGKEIIVIGGHGEDLNDDTRRTSEIFDIKEKRWRKGPDLPFDFTLGQFVKARKSSEFVGYIIGGDDAGRGLVVHGLTKDLKNFVRSNIRIERNKINQFVAEVLPESVVKNCVY